MRGSTSRTVAGATQAPPASVLSDVSRLAIAPLAWRSLLFILLLVELLGLMVAFDTQPLDTIPTAVWFTHDPEVRQVVRNRRAAEILRVPPGGGTPLAVLAQRPYRFQRDGRDLAAD